MTNGPEDRARPDQLVSEALELLNSSKITALFVVDAGKPVGIVHLHDLLRAGVAVDYTRLHHQQSRRPRARP